MGAGKPFVRIFVLAALAIWVTPAVAHGDADAGLETLIKQDLQARHGLDFGFILENWSREFGPRAIPACLHIASLASLSDADRYIALIAAAKLRKAAGGDVAATVTPFLSDDSWMVRNAALVALRKYGRTAGSEAALLLIEDPALVVRLAAVETLRALHPPGTAATLLKCLELPENYGADKKAIWVPQAALRALSAIGAKEVIPALRPYLLRFNDPGLQRAVVKTLENLTETREDGSLPVQVLKWERRLGS